MAAPLLFFTSTRTHHPPPSLASITQEFYTAANDIGFSALFFTNTRRSIVVVPEARVDAHKIPQSGSYDAHESGALVLTFFNTYSMFRSKACLRSTHTQKAHVFLISPFLCVHLCLRS